MEIRWLGQSAFEAKTSAGTVVFDPHPGMFQSGPLQDPNTVMTVSRRGAPGDVPRQVQCFDRPGEYEAGSLSIRGVATPGAVGRAGGRSVNTVFMLDAEGVTICCLGAPSVAPDASALQMIGPVDVLLVRTDGAAMPPDQLAAAARAMEPSLVVPSGFDSSKGAPGQALAAFLRQLGVKQAEPLPRLNVTKSSLPEDLKVIVLSARA